MLYLIFGHTAQEAPLRLGPIPSFKVIGAEIFDHAGTVLARHNGHRWAVQGRTFYRVDCTGPVLVKREGAVHGPYDHFSLVNGTAYASRDLFAHYNEQEHNWHLHNSDTRVAALFVTPG